MGVIAVALCMSACNKDDNPPTPGNQTQEIPDQWGDEKEHVFYYDIDGVEVDVDENGYMLFPKRVNGVPNGESVNYMVIEKKYGYPHKAPKEFAVHGHMACSGFSFKGKRATPWNNVDVYKQMCRTIGFRPESKYNNFEELADLPVRKMKYGPWHMTLETVVSMDIVTHKYFDKNHPAGSSMRTVEGSDPMLPVNMFFQVFSGKRYFSSLLKNDGNYDGEPAVHELGLGQCDSGITTYIGAFGKIYLLGYPEQAGDYPMTLYVELADGKTFSFDFKVKFIDEE